MPPAAANQMREYSDRLPLGGSQSISGCQPADRTEAVQIDKDRIKELDEPHVYPSEGTE